MLCVMLYSIILYIETELFFCSTFSRKDNEEGETNFDNLSE